MSEARFTPGPWKVRPGNTGRSWPAVYSKGYQFVAQLSIGQERPWPQALADSNLIAAAPEMYEALKAFVEAYEKSLQLEKTDVALRLAKAALSKAVPQQESEERK